MDKLQPGQIVVFRKVDDFYFAKIETVREDRVNAAVWLHRHHRWSRALSSVPKGRICEVLPSKAEPKLLDRQINALRRQRNFERRDADRMYSERVALLLKGGAL